MNKIYRRTTSGYTWTCVPVKKRIKWNGLRFFIHPYYNSEGSLVPKYYQMSEEVTGMSVMIDGIKGVKNTEKAALERLESYGKTKTQLVMLQNIEVIKARIEGRDLDYNKAINHHLRPLKDGGDTYFASKYHLYKSPF